MGEMVLEAIQQASTNFLRTAAELVPRAVVTISLILVGWIIAALLKRVTRVVLMRTGFGRLARAAGSGRGAAECRPAPGRVDRRLAGLLGGVDRLPAVGCRCARVLRAPGPGAGVRAVRAPAPGGPGDRRRRPHRLERRLAGHAAGRGERQAAVAAGAGRDGARARPHPDGGHGPRSDCRGPDDRADGVCHRLRRRHARSGHRLRRGRRRRGSPHPRPLVPGAHGAATDDLGHV